MAWQVPDPVWWEEATQTHSNLEAEGGHQSMDDASKLVSDYKNAAHVRLAVLSMCRTAEFTKSDHLLFALKIAS